MGRERRAKRVPGASNEYVEQTRTSGAGSAKAEQVEGARQQRGLRQPSDQPNRPAALAPAPRWSPRGTPPGPRPLGATKVIPLDVDTIGVPKIPFGGPARNVLLQFVIRCMNEVVVGQEVIVAGAVVPVDGRGLGNRRRGNRRRMRVNFRKRSTLRNNGTGLKQTSPYCKERSHRGTVDNIETRQLEGGAREGVDELVDEVGDAAWAWDGDRVGKLLVRVDNVTGTGLWGGVVLRLVQRRARAGRPPSKGRRRLRARGPVATWRHQRARCRPQRGVMAWASRSARVLIGLAQGPYAAAPEGRAAQIL